MVIYIYIIQPILRSTRHLPCSGTCSQMDSLHQKETSLTGRDLSASLAVQERPYPAQLHTTRQQVNHSEEKKEYLKQLLNLVKLANWVKITKNRTCLKYNIISVV